MTEERCLCGSDDCPVCGRLQGTFQERPEPDPDEAYEAMRQEEIDSETE